VTQDESGLEDLLREAAPQVLAALLRRFRDFDAAEDAVQEALVAAATQWPASGLPDSPRAWLIQVASRRLTDHIRTETARRRRQGVIVAQSPADQPAPDDLSSGDRDDTLALLFMCCHPALSSASATALTLRAVGGLTTAEIAAAFMVPEATMAQRISRAKQSIRTSGVPFRLPTNREWAARLSAVMQILYLIFNEGYATTSGDTLVRTDLSGEAIRLTRALHRAVPDEPEIMGLLALMLLTDARRPARVNEEGDLVPLAEQDRATWNRRLIDEGVALVTSALPRGAVGPYQLQAAIAAVHDEAPTADQTDWPQIRALYTVLERIADNPMVTLNRAIAEAMVTGPADALVLVDALAADPRLRGHHRLHAVRAHLLEMQDDLTRAGEEYLLAAKKTTNAAEQRYLLMRAARIRGRDPSGP
jgi:RNA polymerase sigma factor (sigma-70 family)